jgi:hypothetical protein
VLVVLTGGGRLEVLRAGSNHARGEGSCDLHVTTLEELEEALGVLPLLVGRILEDRRDLDIAFLAGRAGEVGVAIACL